jgi:hypothetical protein
MAGIIETVGLGAAEAFSFQCPAPRLFSLRDRLDAAGTATGLETHPFEMVVGARDQLAQEQRIGRGLSVRDD